MTTTKENQEEASPQFQPHFDYDTWLEKKKPKDRSQLIAKGFDIFATKGYFYIVRSDLDSPIYMKIDDLHKPKNKGQIYDLPPAFQNGDHYYGDDGIKYVVHGDIIHATNDLRTDSTPAPTTAFGANTEVPGSNSFMTEGALNGMHYLTHKGNSYRVGYEKVSRWNHFFAESNFKPAGASKETAYEIHEKLRGGLCYFALSDYFYVLKMVDIGGGYERLCFYKVKSLSDDPGLSYYSVHDSVRLFLPGGYTNDKPADTYWEQVGYFKNESSVESDYQHEFKYTHGRSKTETDSLEEHWEVSIKEEVGVSVLIAKASVSAEQKFGGSHTYTTSDQWSESIEESITFQTRLEADETWVIWQPTIKLGGDKTLVAGKHVVATNGELPKDDPGLDAEALKTYKDSSSSRVTPPEDSDRS